ncbi:MAG: hypothetical protein IPJ14_07650 [Kineosporiaceae bacterium]|mgnify:CR=1 FL=1|nr:hypothetical protein [Kineosporiaceae bacterium]MBK7622527.1 hypothetical protein [Kineosporiaceae bacterium]MBK8078440.1 hypothetical protein [Kineosporiaceae bacterium]
MSLLAESPGAMQPEEVPPTRSLPRPQVVDYPHIARCVTCQEYLNDAPSHLAPWTVVGAALTYHDSGHRRDPLTRDDHQFSWI